ncbi:hypothetical protein TPA0907_02680 [Micromonospora humidisoli]|uniref:hypothetical protein n=1 Tax=Micromonospora sp. AKA109 TaxID=2733865 RepID=UPI0022BEB2C7|nr:hypothetical protein [Micromonospora sp. AKA109]GHJ05901.1 hypothetical protein TPA0907_02680 [Micromonospora sp. AKA109]
MNFAPAKPSPSWQPSDRVAAALVDPEQLLDALVELVVADRADVEADLVHQLDRGLVVESGADQRGGPDQVAGADGGGDPALGLRLGPQLLQPGGEVFHPAGRGAVDVAPLPPGGSIAPWKSL